MKKLALSDAQGHWTREDNDGNWVVQDEQGNVLWTFPPGFDEIKVMSAIRLGRKFELEALNKGISFSKEAIKLRDTSLLVRLQNEVKSLQAMNVALSEQLDNHIKG